MDIQQKKKNSIETETSLKKKLEEAEELEDGRETYLIGLIFGFLVSCGLATFIYVKKILDEKWIYAFGLFFGLAIIALLLSIFAYK
jgi:hypothetical protein